MHYSVVVLKLENYFSLKIMHSCLKTQNINETESMHPMQLLEKWASGLSSE